MVNVEEAGRLSESRDLRGEGEVVDMFKRVVKSRSFVSAVLKPPQIVIGVPWPFPHVMVRERVQRPSVLIAVPWDNSYDMRVRTHDNPGVACWNAPPLAVGDDTGNEVGPAIELES